MSTFPHISRRSLLSGMAIMLANPAAFAQTGTKPALRFDNVRYIHRWSKEGQHEFTPEGEDNLTKWNNMVTINRHAAVKNGDQLAEVANRIVDNYRRHGRILKTYSKPAKADQTAEHLVVVIFARPEFIEVAFTRFMLANGAGFAVTYSHRIHERAAGPRMSDWLLANGPRTEVALLGWVDHVALAAAASA